MLIELLAFAYKNTYVDYSMGHTQNGLERFQKLSKLKNNASFLSCTYALGIK